MEKAGFAQTIKVTREWQHIGIEFWSEVEEPDACLTFELGDELSPVEISEVRMGSPLFELYRLDCRARAKGRVVPQPDDVNAVRVEIDELPVRKPSAVQLVVGHDVLQAGEIYVLAVCLRSTSSRYVMVSMSQASSPWEVLGLCERLKISPDWSTHIIEFKATGGGDARLYFDLGQDQALVDIRFASIFPASSRPHHYWTFGEARCDLEFPADRPTSVRALVTPSESPTDQCVQLCIPDIMIRSHSRYAVTFRAKADEPRDVGFGVGKNEMPWDDLGIYHIVGIGSSWKPYYYEFVANDNCDNARLVFDVGQSNIPVEFEDVKVNPLHREEYEMYVSRSDSRTTFKQRQGIEPN